MGKNDSKYMRPPSCRRIVWVAYAKLLTLPIPDKFLIYASRNGRLATQARRQAWREKIALFISYLIISGLFCFWLEFISTLFCNPPKTFEYSQVYTNNSKYSSINGDVVNWNSLENQSDMTEQVNLYPGQDLSPMFPLFMILQRPAGQTYYDDSVIDQCIRNFNKSKQADNWLQYKLLHDSGYVFKDDQLVSCPIPGRRNVTGASCFYTEADRQKYATYHKKGSIKFDIDMLQQNFSVLPNHGSPGMAFVILDGKVLDVTDYLDAATNVVLVAKEAHSRSFAFDRMFLPLDLTILLFISLGQDITISFYSQIANAEQYKECLLTLFYHGVVEGDTEEGCARVNLALWITLGTFLLYFLIKMNLAHLSRLPCMQKFLFMSVPPTSLAPLPLPTTEKEKMTMSTWRYAASTPFVLLFVPCYSESSEALRQTFDSLARTSYPDSHKLLFFVCDGLVKNRSDTKESYRCILDALGYSSSSDPEPRAYVSLGMGHRRVNYAKVYAGFYESGRNRVPFIMVAKVGSAREQQQQQISTTIEIRAPGNRGKRDSMVIVLGFLERCMDLARNRLSPLEFELFSSCYNFLGINPHQIQYMLMTDGDIQVQEDAVTKMMSRLEADPKLIAINGYIRPANPEENIVTMLQVFPSYMAFFSGLAYEACLGSVTTINGGFIMYRIWSKSLTENSSEDGPATFQHKITRTTSSPNDIRLKKLNKSIRPKVNDEIAISESNSSAYHHSIDLEDGFTSSDEDEFNTTSTTAIRNSGFTSYRRRRHRISTNTNKPRRASQILPTATTSASFAHTATPCCIQSTVLRSFATAQPNTLHMENVLLLGEEQYFGTVLLRSHPCHRLGFDPEAIGYSTLPRNFFALQALQIRTLRTTFHTQLELLHVSKHLGTLYLILSLTKMLDMIFSMPIIVYLYVVYIRYFMYKDLAYAIIAGAFTGLVMLHVFSFVVRGRFRYVVWFAIYAVLGVPLFSIWLPVLSVWYMDDADRWVDVWPTKKQGYRSRLHGVVLNEDENEEGQVEEVQVVRLRLAEFEVLEAKKLAQREKEQAEWLDAKFNGFTAGYVSSNSTPVGHKSKTSWTSLESSSVISPPLPSAQLNTSCVKMEKNGFLSSNTGHYTPTFINSDRNNPFASPLDNPFDDVYGGGVTSVALPPAAASGVSPTNINCVISSSPSHHSPNMSQSSHLSRSSFPHDMFVPNNNGNTGVMIDDESTMQSGYHHENQHQQGRSYSSITSSSADNAIEHEEHTTEIYPLREDNESITSLLTDSMISLDLIQQQEEDIPTGQSYRAPQRDLVNGDSLDYGSSRYQRYHPLFVDENDMGRSSPVHSKFRQGSK